jgi:hypothetical protein
LEKDVRESKCTIYQELRLGKKLLMEIALKRIVMNTQANEDFATPTKIHVRFLHVTMMSTGLTMEMDIVEHMKVNAGNPIAPTLFMKTGVATNMAISVRN